MCEARTLPPLSLELDCTDRRNGPAVFRLGSGCASARLMVVASDGVSGTLTWVLEESIDGAHWVQCYDDAGDAIGATPSSGAVYATEQRDAAGLGFWRVRPTTQATTGRLVVIVGRAGNPENDDGLANLGGVP
jgi:hypothetical protein